MIVVGLKASEGLLALPPSDLPDLFAGLLVLLRALHLFNSVESMH